MKIKFLITIVTISIFMCYCSRNGGDVSKSISRPNSTDTIGINDVVIPSIGKSKLNISILIGMWATTTDADQNAAFELMKNSIRYLDMADSDMQLFPIAINKNTLEIFLEDYVVKEKIFFLSKDSFFTINEGDTERYFRR